MTEPGAPKWAGSKGLLLIVVATLLAAQAPRAQAPLARAPLAQASRARNDTTMQAGDAPAAMPGFDVVSIKPDKSDNGSSYRSTTNNRFIATNVSLNVMVQFAYDIKEDLISGISGPVASAHFDVEAKVIGSDSDSAASPNLTYQQVYRMLVPMLADRFQLKAHREIKTLPVYELIVARGGGKLTLSTTASQESNWSMNAGPNGREFTLKGATMAALASVLTDQVHRTVIDKTGLAGTYDVVLKWSPDDSAETPSDTGLSIFTALKEQLALKLQPARGPVETLVVDHAQMPSAD